MDQLIQLLNKVNEFNTTFEVGDKAEKTTLISFEESKLRFDLMDEENREYKKACLDRDLVEVADALGDKMYILLGSILRHGLQDKIFDIVTEIHRSNMSKLENGKVIKRNDGKILKGKSYFKPNLKEIIE